MKSMKALRLVSICGAVLGMLFSGPVLGRDQAMAADGAGSVIALRGRASIERDGRTLDARVRDAVLLQDTVSTYASSRLKLLFRDDSVLTLGENSRATIREFVQGRGTGNKAIFNLIDGKMRSVVGKSGLEVRTPTAVAAARGTVILFETGILNGKKVTIILAYEGEVGLKSIDPKISGSVLLSPGMLLTVVEGEPLGTPTPASPEVIRRMMMDTDLEGYEISVPEPGLYDIGGMGLLLDIPQLPGISQPAVNTTTPVHVIITFP